MNKFKFSFFYIAALAILNLFHSKLERFVYYHSLEGLVFYVLSGLFLSFFLIVLQKVIKARKNTEIAMMILILGVVFFFMTSRPRIGFKISIFEFFLLGCLLAIEDKRIKLLIPLILLFIAAILVEVTANIWVNKGIFYNDIWRSILFGLGGYVSLITFKRA